MSDCRRLFAPAKVNLDLAVGERRADGFHEVRTTMLALDLCDELEVSLGAAGDADAIELLGPAATPDIPTDGTNLALRAVAAVRTVAAAKGRPSAERGLRVRLTKHIPAGAGLGGGSSDAAAALHAAARLLDVDLDPATERELLANLGSDCPFFATARTNPLATCTGRGEVVTPLVDAVFPWWVVVFTPDVACPTGAVYGAHVARQPTVATVDWRDIGTLDEARASLTNDLEEAALAAVPELMPWRELLDQKGARHFRLTGSGSSFFGLFASEAEARAETEKIAIWTMARDLALRGRWSLRPPTA